jgi:hypothetical protein
MKIKRKGIILLLLIISMNGNAQSVETCAIPVLPIVKFDGTSVKLNKTIKDSLDMVFRIIQQYPSCKIDIIASANHARGVQTWGRVNAIVNHFAKKGIESERFILAYSEDMDATKIQFRAHQDWDRIYLYLNYMDILFCNNPLDSKTVDPDFTDEFAAAQQSGFSTHLFSFEGITRKNGDSFSALRTIKTSDFLKPIIYRGWMLKPKQY